MRIFFVCRRVPFPPDRGDKIATFNEIRHLSAGHEVHVFCLGDGSQDLHNIPELRKYARSITAAPVNALRIKLRALKALLTGEPLSVAAFNEARLHTAIRRKFDELRPDLIIVYSCNVAQFAEHFPYVPRIMQFGDLDSLKWRQYAERSRLPLKWIYAIEERRFLAYERRVADTRPYLDRAEIFVAPLRMARGVQNKVLEALAMGLPCVTSIAAWRGTVVSDGEGILATDDPEGFAQHVVSLLRDGDWRAEMGRKARAAAEANYQWEEQMALLDQVITAAVSQSAPNIASVSLERV